MQFQHLFVNAPTHFKEQIAHLEIAVFESSKPKEPARTGRFSDKTLILLECVQTADRPIFPQEVAEKTGYELGYCRGQLSKFIQQPKVYGIKPVTINNKRAYQVI